jgi:hypothetical protein
MTETPTAPTGRREDGIKVPPRSYTVRNYIDADKLKADIAYSLTNLSDAMQMQAPMIVHYSTLAAQAAKQVDDIKLLIEAAESKVYRKLRDEATEAKEKVTEAQLEKNVAASGIIVSLKKALNEAKQIEAIAKGAVEGFKHRKDMLVQEGASTRQEREGDLRMLGIAANADAIEAAKERFLERKKPQG